MTGSRTSGEGIASVFLAMEQMVADLDKVVPSFRVADRPGRGKAVDKLLVQFQKPWLSDLINPVAQALHFPGHTLLKYQNRTLADLLDEHLTDPLAKAYLAQLAVGIGTAPGSSRRRSPGCSSRTPCGRCGCPPAGSGGWRRRSARCTSRPAGPS